MQISDIQAGSKFGRWTTIKPTSGKYWLCKCSCGKRKSVLGWSLIYGTSKSCGCLHREVVGKQSTKHGKSHSSEYYSYWMMRQRCLNPKNTSYHLYGGRGITICDRWLNGGFKVFLVDMGDKPTLKHSIERLDNNAGYSPENCKWATAHEQGNNKRVNHRIQFDGREQTLTQWARELGLSPKSLDYRLSHGWSVQDALTIPTSQSGWTAKRMRS